MATTFNTLKYAQTLEQSGFSHDQSAAMAIAFDDAQQESLAGIISGQEATENDIWCIRNDIQSIRKDISDMNQHLAVLKWGIGLLVAMALSVIVKTFFG